MRILVTNDDGITSEGLHVLAERVAALGDVIVVAPSSEFSGAGAAVGPIHLALPEVHDAEVKGASTAFTVDGPPALCVFLARLGAFGEVPDLIVSGVNPGYNVGRSVYHSGTVGAAVTGRNGGINGVAVSQGTVAEEPQHWDAAAEVAAWVAETLLVDLPSEPVVCNVNVPNLPLDQLGEVVHTRIGETPPFATAKAALEPIGAGRYRVEMTVADPVEQPRDLDTGAVVAGAVSIGWIGPWSEPSPPGHTDRVLDTVATRLTPT
ncbi:MAG: 5'/3'-nucleotidase SurE [Actinomycetota bacterium]|nr:5'/3'-nucleotidase SurE [Actinomycetota bacterium]